MASDAVQAVFYDSYGAIDKLRIGELPPPRPGGGEIDLRVTRAALNPKDAVFRRGRFKIVSGGGFPKRCGLDFAGVVTESRSPRFSPGQRVFGMLDEWRFRRGSLAQSLVCRDVEAAVIPDGVTDEAAAGAALAGSTALQALRDIGQVAAGTRVLVHGAAGGVGTFAIQIARILGAEVHTTSSEHNFDLCRRLGAVQTWDYAAPALADSQPRYDVIFDVFGNLAFARVRSWLARPGILIGTVPGPRRLARDLLTRFGRVEERLVIVRPRPRDLDQLGDWLAGGELETVIEATFPLARVHDAFRKLESKHARGKILIEVS